MFRLVLPILTWSQEVVEKYGITNQEVPYKIAKEETFILYEVTALSPAREDGVTYTVIHVPGTSFVTKLSMEQVDELIQKAHDKVVFL